MLSVPSVVTPLGKIPSLITPLPLPHNPPSPLCALCVLCGETSPLTPAHTTCIIARMYHTNGTRADITTTERKPPTIADIVRKKTDDGARIIDFFLDLMEGRVDGAKLCHRIDAAKQLVKYGSKDAADFIAGLSGEPCGHCESRRRGPRSRKDESPAAGPLHPPAHLAPDFLTLLTEDFLTVLSAVDEDLMIKLVRAQTRDGDTVVEFLVRRHAKQGRRLQAQPQDRRRQGAHLAHTPRRAPPSRSHNCRSREEPAPYSIRAGTRPRSRAGWTRARRSREEPAPYSIRGGNPSPAPPGRP